MRQAFLCTNVRHQCRITETVTESTQLSWMNQTLRLSDVWNHRSTSPLLEHSTTLNTQLQCILTLRDTTQSHTPARVLEQCHPLPYTTSLRRRHLHPRWTLKRLLEFLQLGEGAVDPPTVGCVRVRQKLKFFGSFAPLGAPILALRDEKELLVCRAR